MAKNLPAVQEVWVPSLGREGSTGEGNGDPLQYSCLENPLDRGFDQLESLRSQRAEHDSATHTLTSVSAPGLGS